MYSAGVLPYAVVDGKLYFLLGMDRRDNSWSDFGGRSETGDSDDPRITAGREFYEESAGAIMPYQGCLRTIQGCNAWRSLTVGKNDYYMFVARIPYTETLPETFTLILALASYAKLHKKFTEKTKVAWFSYERVLEAAQGGSGAGMRLRFVFADSLQRNKEQLKKFAREVLS
jgi:predicted NUDIX family NTP pyrophosphohydrolase